MEDEQDPFDIVSTKHAAVDRLKRWRQAALVLNSSRRFRYTLDLKKQEISLQEILSFTSNFADENIIKESRFGKYYKGQMMQSGQLIDIIARRFNCSHVEVDIEFKTEKSMLFSLKHKNISSIIGSCDEKDEKIIIYEHAVHGCLDQHLSDPTLTWFQRLQICLGVAHALTYIHYDVIHCDINSSNIFLDKNWEPKIYGFQLSTKYPQSWRHRLLFSHYFDNTILTPKYDVYSFGTLLFEVLCGKKPMIGDDGEMEELDEIIDPNLRKQMDAQSLSVFTKIAYSCLNQQLVERPTMDSVVKVLEAALEHQWKYENLGHLTDADDTSSSNLKAEWLKIPLSEIMLATCNFHEKFCVGFGGFGIVYKAELDVLDIQSLSSLERKCKDELPKRSKIVAIKRIFSRPDDQGKQGFLTEIELLSSCKHPNIVSLLGYSREAHEMILVYEFAFKGSLNDYFGSTGKTINLTWVQRIQICLDVAHGINYLHTNMEGKPRIIHRDIKSENILLDENLNAKVADFGLSKFHPLDQQASTVYTKNIAGTEVYLDPEYLTSFKYKKESDIYSFGVVLFEILSGRVAYDPIFMVENDKGLAPIARRRYNEGTLKELIDSKIIEEDDEYSITLNRGPNQDSFEVFSRIAYQCLAETQAKRPTMEVVIKELQNALNLQGETAVLTTFRLNDIMLATQNFSETYFIGLHTHGMVYKADLHDYDKKCSMALEPKNNSGLPKKLTPVAIKRISSSKRGQGKEWFFSEIEMRTSFKHRNIVSLLGICDEGDELALIYEHASNNSLDDYLRRVDNMNYHTWKQRLNMCLKIARGLDHLHTKMDDQQMIIHGDIRCANILLGENWDVKIAYFGISKFHSSNKEASTKVYCDPEYEKTGKLKIESDIYSFGVVLFEIFSGRLAYDPVYIGENDKGLAPIARERFNEGTINRLIDPKLKEESDEDLFTSSTGPNQSSLDTFSKIAYQCLVETQAERPTMEIIIKELEIALNLQENVMKNLQISLEEIQSATDDFDEKNCIGSGRYWKAYKGELKLGSANANGRITIVAKRWDSKSSEGDASFLTEIDILYKHNHGNIIGLVGYCNEMDEKIIAYEHATRGSLDKYLGDANLTWMKRLKVCIDVASALEFLHGSAVMLKKVVHRNIKSQSILLNDDWKAKISNLELSLLDSVYHDMEHVSENAYGTIGYLEPQFKEGFVTEKSDIYSFGMVLFEVLCGRLAWVDDKSWSLGTLAKKYFSQGKLDEIVFEGIKEQIVPQSLTTFANVAHKCLNDDGDERPDASEVLLQLKKALEFQEDYEIWEPKLPRDYKEIISLLKNPKVNYTQKKKDLYKKLASGIFLQKEKVWLILSKNRKTNKMISATMFSYENRESHKWRSIHKSRFGTVAKMLDISNLKIQINVNTQFLSPGVFYRVNLVFKFCDQRKYSSKPMYVNLKYRNWSRPLHVHSYFATWRDDGWMMIELCRLHHEEDFDFIILLESLSRYHCRSDGIYIEGIEFQAIANVAHEDIDKEEEGQYIEKPISNVDQVHQLLTNSEEIYMRSKSDFDDDDDDGDDDKKFSVSEVNGKKHLMLFAAKILYNSSKLETFRYKAVANYSSRSQALVELLPQQVFRVKYKIKRQMLSPFTEYACYLVFALSENCRGLHCPVKVRDLLHRRSKETKIIYFRSTNPLNQYDSFWVPERRKDGWMEVMVWTFNSKYKLGQDIIRMNLKLITYEGTMAGLIIRGLEFRPV